MKNRLCSFFTSFVFSILLLLGLNWRAEAQNQQETVLNHQLNNVIELDETVVGTEAPEDEKSAKLETTLTTFEQSSKPTKFSPIVIGTLDGRVICLDGATGSEIWAMKTGASLVKSSLLPLIPSINGNLYLYHNQNLEKHPMNIYEIVSKSPFSMNDKLLYLGSKETHLYAIHPSTGHSFQCKGSSEDPCEGFDIKGRVLVMRTDYHVKAIDQVSGESKWNVSLGEFSTISSFGLPVDSSTHTSNTSFSSSQLSTISSDSQNPLFSKNESNKSSSYSDHFEGYPISDLPPTHGLLSGMDGSLHLIDAKTGKIVWSIKLSSPAIHTQHNFVPAIQDTKKQSKDEQFNSKDFEKFVLGDLKFIPQLMLDLDKTALKPGEHRIFVGEHSGSLLAIEQLAQYNHFFTYPSKHDDMFDREDQDSKYGDSHGVIHDDEDDLNDSTYHLNPSDFPSINLDQFTSPRNVFPPALPSDLNNGDGAIILSDQNNNPFDFTRSACKGEDDMSLDCILGIHYVKTNPNCVGDDCICDSIPRLPNVGTPRLPDRPSNPHLPLHPNFDWEKGDYDFILYGIILFDWYLHRFKSLPIYLQVLLTTATFAAFFVISKLIKKMKKSVGSNRNSESSTSSDSSNNVSTKSNANSQNEIKQDVQPVETILKPSIPDMEGTIRVGKLQVYTSKILGHGSSGTVVFEGSMNNRKVAVKRMLKTFFSIAERETHVLTQSDEHPNVIRYYTTEEDSDFIYLALSYADKSLSHHIEDEDSFSTLDANDKRSILFQLAKGLQHLHSINIVHRDIKPQNVLITASRTVKISDMGLAKKLEAAESSFSTAAHGTIGWQAPELVLSRIDSESLSNSISTSTSESGSIGSNGKSSNSSSEKKNSGRVKISKKVDIFSMGCLFYYVLTRRHPFGDRLTREANIVNNSMTLNGITAEAIDLISKMLNQDPKLRPSADQILDHPYFWDSSKRLRFLKDASDFLEFEKPTSDVVMMFEDAAQQNCVIPGNDWVVALPNELIQDLNKFRKYNGSKLRDLLRVIRNKAHHYRDLPIEAQQTFGALPEGFLDYFCHKRFPTLLMFTYEYARIHYFEDKVFKEYFTHEESKSQIPFNTTSLCSSIQPEHTTNNSNNQSEISPNIASPPQKHTGPAWKGSIPVNVLSPNTPKAKGSVGNQNPDLPPGIEIDSRDISKSSFISPTRRPANSQQRNWNSPASTSTNWRSRK